MPREPTIPDWEVNLPVTQREARQAQLALRERILLCVINSNKPEHEVNWQYWELQARECRTILLKLEKIAGKLVN